MRGFVLKNILIAIALSLLANNSIAQDEHEHHQHHDHSQHQMHDMHKKDEASEPAEEMDHSMHGGHHGGHHGHHNMTLDASGMVMNSNADKLPMDCKAISQEYEFTVYAGTEFAKDIPGNVFGLSDYEWQVAPCSKLTVTFINKDKVRHQWMVHGLPKYLYPQGMFHLEAAGGAEQTGTFIVPSDNQTYLVHCDMAQHMEKGMKAQLVVGSGGNDLWAVAGVSNAFKRDDYLPEKSQSYFALVLAASTAITLLIALKRRT